MTENPKRHLQILEVNIGFGHAPLAKTQWQGDFVGSWMLWGVFNILVYVVVISVFSIGFVSCTWNCLWFIIVNVEIRSPLSSLLLNIEIQEQKHQFKNLTKNSSTSPRKQGLLKPLRQRIDEKFCSAKMPSWHGTSKKRSLPKSMDPSASGDATGTNGIPIKEWLIFMVNE